MWNKHPHDGNLTAYLHEPTCLSDEVREHIARCQYCLSHLDNIRQQQEDMNYALALLEPTQKESSHKSDARAALAHKITQEQEREKMIEKLKTSPQIQRRVVWGTLALLLVASFALAPVRAAASDFLSLFRVERFVLIDVDPERMQEIAEAVEDTMTFGQSEFDGEAQYEIVASVEEAAARAGFVPRSLTGQGTLTSVGVTGEQTISFTPDVEAMRLVFSNLGLDPELIPGNIDGQTLTMTWGAGIAQTYGDPQADGLSLMQMPAPVVDIPDGTDMDQLGTAMLMLLGMSEEEAARLSKDIDWTTTLVIPVPRDHMNSIQEVTVNGNSGLAFRTDSYWDEVNETRVEPPEVLIWQEGGFIYAITGKGDLLIIANSLQ